MWALVANWFYFTKKGGLCIFTVNKYSLVIVLRDNFTVLTKASQTPPIHGLTGGLSFHWMCSSLKVWATLFWSMQVSTCFSSFSAPMKLEPLSDLNIFTWPCQAINLQSANMNASVITSVASSKCPPHVVRHLNKTLHLFTFGWVERICLIWW